MHMPAVLDVLACALARWRVLLVHPSFVLVEPKVEEDDKKQTEDEGYALSWMGRKGDIGKRRRGQGHPLILFFPTRSPYPR